MIQLLLNHPNIETNCIGGPKQSTIWHYMCRSLDDHDIHAFRRMKHLLMTTNANVNAQNADGDTPIVLALKNEFADAVLDFLGTNGVDPTIPNTLLDTVLHLIPDIDPRHILSRVYDDIVTTLIENREFSDAIINLRNASGHTPLYVQRLRSFHSILLRHPLIDVNLLYENDNTILHLEIDSDENYMDLALELLDRNETRVSLKRHPDGLTPLMLELRKKWLITDHIVRRIISHPTFDPSVRDASGLSALHHLVKGCSVCYKSRPNCGGSADSALQLFDMLVRLGRFDLNAQDAMGCTVLHLLAIRGQHELVKILLKARVNDNDKGSRRQADRVELLRAAWHQDADVKVPNAEDAGEQDADVAEEQDAEDPEEQDADVKLPNIEDAGDQLADVKVPNAEDTEEQDADVKAPNVEDTGASDKHDIEELMPADKNIQDKYGCTPLHYVSMGIAKFRCPFECNRGRNFDAENYAKRNLMNYEEVARALLDIGADSPLLDCRNEAGKTPLDEARASPNSMVIANMIKKYEESDIPSAFTQ